MRRLWKSYIKFAKTSDWIPFFQSEFDKKTYTRKLIYNFYLNNDEWTLDTIAFFLLALHFHLFWFNSAFFPNCVFRESKQIKTGKTNKSIELQNIPIKWSILMQLHGGRTGCTNKSHSYDIHQIEGKFNEHFAMLVPSLHVRVQNVTTL